MTVFQCNSCEEWHCDKCENKYECFFCEDELCDSCIVVQETSDGLTRAFCSEKCFLAYEEENFPEEEEE